MNRLLLVYINSGPGEAAHGLYERLISIVCYLFLERETFEPLITANNQFTQPNRDTAVFQLVAKYRLTCLYSE